MGSCCGGVMGLSFCCSAELLAVQASFGIEPVSARIGNFKIIIDFHTMFLLYTEKQIKLIN